MASSVTTEEKGEATIIITLCFLGLEGQTSSPEAECIGHGHLHNSLLKKR